MYYIKATPNESGNYGNPKGKPFPGSVALPDALLSAYISAKGFVLPVIENGQVESLAVNEEALAAYEAANQPDISELKAAKKEEISAACRETIVAGFDAVLSDGTTGHFALTEADQINLDTAYAAVKQGAEGYPYHADDQRCKIYPAADIITIGNAAIAHKLYHTTYCNHVFDWIRQVETVEELEAITYGAELPEELAASMAEILSYVSAV